MSVVSGAPEPGQYCTLCCEDLSARAKKCSVCLSSDNIIDLTETDDEMNVSLEDITPFSPPHSLACDCIDCFSREKEQFESVQRQVIASHAITFYSDGTPEDISDDDDLLNAIADALPEYFPKKDTNDLQATQEIATPGRHSMQVPANSTTSIQGEAFDVTSLMEAVTAMQQQLNLLQGIIQQQAGARTLTKGKARYMGKVI